MEGTRKQTTPPPPSRQEVAPPSAVHAEQAVLGGIMIVPDALDRIAGELLPDHFYIYKHRVIYSAILEMAEKSRPYDPVTLGEWLESAGKLDAIDGAHYLTDLASNVASAANIVAYAQLVKDKAILRDLIEVSNLNANDAFNPGNRDPSEILSVSEQRVFSLGERVGGNTTTIVPLRSALADAFSVLQDRYSTRGQPTGVQTGYGELDKLTAGLQPTDLIILAARPAQGKTTLALNIAEYAATKTGVAAAVFSMEMSSSQLSMRLLSSAGRIDSTKLRTGDLDDADWPRVTEAIRHLRDAKIFIDDTPALTPDAIRSRARRLKREHNIGLIVVDYLQLMHIGGTKENRATEISEISRSLKALAKELNVPVLALSQLNRSLESRTDKRPVMADLRESGAIEQDADAIVFIYRDEYYNKDSPDKGLAEIIIGKQRNGPTGTVKLRFFGAYTRFDNYDSGSNGSFE